MMFNINGYDWEVVYVNPGSSALTRSNGTVTLGSCDISARTIYISKRLPEHMRKKVLIHEICHASMASYHIELTIDQEELLCDLMATYGEEVIDIANNIFKRLGNVDITRFA